MAFSSSSHFVTSFLVALLISCYIFSSTSAARDLAQKTNNEFMKTSCSATTHSKLNSKLCLTSLLRHSSAIQTSPKLMANTALIVTLAYAKSTSTMMSKLSQSHDMKLREVGAMSDCIEELSDLLDAIQRSIAEMGNVQAWVSAALTDETTCSDGFGGNGMNGNLKTVVRGRVVNIAQLTSNALALINRYASVHG
ncbi:21 kDa protein-like [Pyrus communis]|uniref:21 kDa protein-like n=1 Tax=Pyrus communis TaxID=23211 RepID=UPI0035C0F8BC